MRNKISEENAKVMGQSGTDPFYGAPVILIVIADKSASTAIYDGSLVMGNLLNAAESFGLGSMKNTLKKLRMLGAIFSILLYYSRRHRLYCRRRCKSSGCS